MRHTFIRIVCLAAMCLSTAAEASIIRLRRTATVDNSLIRLSDIADIYTGGDDADYFLGNLTLAPAPLPGSRVRLRLEQIESRLRAHEVSAADIEFQGSTIVVVSRDSRQTSPRSKYRRKTSSDVRLASATDATESRQELQQTASPRSQSPFVKSAELQLARDLTESLIREFVSVRAPDWGTPFVQPLISTSDVPAILSARSDSIRVNSLTRIGDDHYSASLSLPNANAQSSVISIRVRIARKPKVFAARRHIPSGSVLTAHDLIEVEVDNENNGITNLDAIVGMETRRSLSPDEVIRDSNLTAVDLVRRGDIVRVRASIGGIRVYRDFRAKQSGAMNDIVTLTSLIGKDVLPARVTGTREATIVESRGTSSPGRTASTADNTAVRRIE